MNDSQYLCLMLWAVAISEDLSPDTGPLYREADGAPAEIRWDHKLLRFTAWCEGKQIAAYVGRVPVDQPDKMLPLWPNND